MYWELYGPFAQGSFDSIGFNQNARYSFKILKKNYNGRPILIPPDTVLYPDPIIQCLCAGNPGVLRYLNDDIVGIKGAEFILTLINKDNQLPLSTFYSEEEDTFKLVVDMTYEVSSVDTTVRIFEGFLIQEDSNEVLTDIAHEIQLSFTDNLGALKNIDFYQASMTSATSAANLRTGRDNMEVLAETATKSPIIKIYNPTMSTTSPVVGDFIFLNDSPSGDVAYKIIKIETDSVATYLWIDRPPITFSLTSSVLYTVITGSDVYSRIKLSDVLRICLHGTNMNLDVVYAGNLTAIESTNETTQDFWNTIYVDARTFLQDQNNWLSCYEVLDRVCKRFNISAFQQDGKWHLIRTYEYVRYNSVIPGINYTGYLVQQSTGNVTSLLNFGNESDIETGIEQSILRPYNFSVNNFKFVENNKILFNADLQILGPKKSSTTETINSITYIYDEYVATGFDDLVSGLSATFEINIRVVKKQDTLDEVDRYIVVRYLSGVRDGYDLIYRTKPIEVNSINRLKITFDVREKYSTPNISPQRLGIDIRYGNAANDYYYLSTATDSDTGLREYRQPPFLLSRVSLLVGSGWTTKTYETEFFPTDGLLYFYFGLDCTTNSPFPTNNERYYKNISIEIINETNSKNVVNGQSHKSYVNKIIKNNIINDVYFDDTLRNSLYGTFFYGTNTQNLLRIKTEKWSFIGSDFELKLGEITTREVMGCRLKPRTKLEGRILGIVKADDTRFKIINGLLFLVNNNTYFIFGKAEYELKSDTINCTLFEMYTEQDYIDNQFYDQYLPNIKYEFKYLYK